MKVRAIKIIEIIFICFITIIFVSIPIISFKGNILEDVISFEGNIFEDGDHFASTFSPFLSFLGSILVYLAFKAQIKANDKIQKQFDKQNYDENFFRLIDNIEKRLNNSEIEHFEDNEREKGYAILDYIIEEIDKTHNLNSKIFGEYILINNPECLSDEIWNVFYKQLEESVFESSNVLKREFINADLNYREEIVNDKVSYNDIGKNEIFTNLEREIFNLYFYKQDNAFFDIYYNHIYIKFFDKYKVFFDAYFKSVSMILKHIDSAEKPEFYKDYLNDNLTNFEKTIIWMAASDHRFGKLSRERIFKFDILLALENTKGINAVENTNYYPHIIERLKSGN